MTIKSGYCEQTISSSDMSPLIGMLLILATSVILARKEHKWNAIMDKIVEQCFTTTVHKYHTPQVMRRYILSCYGLAFENLKEDMSMELNSSHRGVLNFHSPLVWLNVASSKAEPEQYLNATIMFTSHEELRGNFTFTHISMAYSGIDCPYDKVILIDTIDTETVMNRTLCGIRDRYSYFSVGKEVKIIIQPSGGMPFNIKLRFQPVDKEQIIDHFAPGVLEISNSNNRMLNIKKPLLLPNDFYFSYHIRYKNTYYESVSLAWILRADAGFSVNITLGHLTDVHQIQIYEGGLLLPEALRFQYVNQTNAYKSLLDTSSLGPVLTVSVQSRLEHFGLIYYMHKKAAIQRQIIAVDKQTTMSLTDICTPMNNVIYCLITMETKTANSYINLTIDAYSYKGPDSFDCLYSEVLLYDGKFRQIEGTDAQNEVPFTPFLSNTKDKQNALVFTFCRENTELYLWPFISSSSAFSLLIVGYTFGNPYHHTHLSVSVVATKCRGMWRGGVGVLGRMEFVPHGCSIRQERPFRGIDTSITDLSIFNMNQQVSTFRCN